MISAMYGQKAPSAIGCIKTPKRVPPEPQEVLRQKAPSAIGCIKTQCVSFAVLRRRRQKAPSAIRCIKTVKHERAARCRP